MLHRTVGLHPSAQELSCSDDVTILFDCSTRDGELAKAQNLLDHGKPEVDEEIADQFQQSLKKAIPQFKEIGAYLYIWDGLPFCDDPRNLTMHTIIAVPAVYSDPNGFGISAADWAYNAANGRAADYGLDLADQVYGKTEQTQAHPIRLK